MATPLEQVRAGLAEGYLIERELGSGGMATVFLARDRKHDRDVAVKVLRSDLAAAVGPERFLREIRITARLNHPHILPLLDSGEAGELLFYVMPYVEGGSMRRLLPGGTTLDLDDVLRITRQVASALDYAHRHGVEHRDVKPENILFSERLAVVADFGLAKAISLAGPRTMTRSGVPLGTPGYMSPEQAMGAPDVDQCTDVYSLACVVYEALVGETPAFWPTNDDLRLGRLQDAPPAHRQRLDQLPGRVEQVLVKALALRPADRIANPGELATALAAATERTARLDDDEVRAVIRRASELQAAQPTEHGALSVGTVEQIAAEVGIPPDRVREAMLELGTTTSRPLPSPMARPPATPAPHPAEELAPQPVHEVFDHRRQMLHYDRTADREVAPSEFPGLVDEIQTTLRLHGHTTTVGNTLTWTPVGQGARRNLMVTVTPADGRTLVHVEERFELEGWKLFTPGWGAAGGLLFGAGLSQAIAAPEPAIGIVALVGGALGAYVSVKWSIFGAAKQQMPELQWLAERLAELANRPPGSTPPPPAEVPPGQKR
ncbi:MAG: serine/threonine-protein kinase [Gemmatimonadota bacterium]